MSLISAADEEQEGQVFDTGSPMVKKQLGWISDLMHTGRRLMFSYLQSREEWVSLLVLQVMDEIMMLILPESCSVASSVADNLVSVASPSMKVQSNQVSRHLQSIRRDHLPSFR